MKVHLIFDFPLPYYIDAVSPPGQCELSAFRRNEVSLCKYLKLHDHTLKSCPCDCQSVGETTSPTHQPSVSQTHINYLPVYDGLTAESQLNEIAPGPTIETNKGLNTAESERKIEPLQDTTQALQVDSPLADKTLARNQTSVRGTSLSSQTSIDETSNHLPVNEASTNNLPKDKPPPSNNQPMGTASQSSHPSLDKPPPSHHLPGDGTSPNNEPLVDGTLTPPSKRPPAGGTLPSNLPPIVDGTSPSNHPSVDKTPPSKRPPMTYTVPLSSHSPVNESQPSRYTPIGGTLHKSHPGSPIMDGTLLSNHSSVDKTANSKCLPLEKPPPCKYPLTDFGNNQQSVDDSLFTIQPPVEVLSRINHPAECELQLKSELPAKSTVLPVQTQSNCSPVCEISQYSSSQVSTNVNILSYQPPANDKLCDKHTQHETPSLSREEVRNV